MADGHDNSRFDSPRRNHTSQRTADRLSALPENIISHVLSFLPFEDILRTSLLSRHWRNIWNSTPSLCFSYRGNHSDEHMSRKFISFVDKALLLFNSSKVHKLSVEFPGRRIFHADFSVWLMYAISHKVQELHLNLDSSSYDDVGLFRLPRVVFVNSCLRKLVLICCGFGSLGEIIRWESIKELTIGSTGLSNDAILKIVRGSPVLECLELRNCSGFDNLDFDPGSLRKLVINGYENREKKHSSLGISAPSARSLEILGSLDGMILQLSNVSALVKVKLDFHLKKLGDGTAYDNKVHHDMLMDMFFSLDHVKNIELGTWCIEVLSLPEEKVLPSPLSKLMLGEKDKPSLLSNCKCLTLQAPIQKPYLSGILSLLQSSINLETLIISMSSPKFQFESADGMGYWTSGLCRGLVLRIKTIIITGFEGKNYGLELPFLQFLLKNTQVLEKMVINAWSVGRGVKPRMLLDELRVAQNLLSFPRSSKKAEIVFKQ